MSPASPKKSSGGSRKTTAKKSTKKSTGTATKKTAKKKAAKQAKKSTAKKTAAKKTTSRRKAAAPKKTAARKTAPAKTAKKTTARKAPAAKAPPKKTTRPAARKLDKKAIAGIKTKLSDELVSLQRQQAELEEDSFDGTQSDITGEVGIDEDFADAGTATFDRERDLSIRNNIGDLIDQIERALVRIDDGTYGICERCGRPIDPARLKALPHALLCMDCKRREERAR